jgi:DeoR family transcriptional regulator, fructose operon transcriptional repressor
MKKELVFVEERKQAIADYVLTKRKATVAELCMRFDVSSATIRNDLRDLEQNGALIRTHGGAIVQEKARYEPEAKEKEIHHSNEKKLIAALALTKIEDGDTIIVDTGTTTQELAYILNSKHDITVLTNDLVIALYLEDHPSTSVHLLGGVVRKHFHCTVGPNAVDSLKFLTVDKAFIGTNCFSTDKGGTAPDFLQAELKRQMISIATKVYMLVDSSKIGKNSFIQFAPIDKIDCLITDSIGDEDRELLEESGVEVLVAGKSSLVEDSPLRR